MTVHHSELSRRGMENAGYVIFIEQFYLFVKNKTFMFLETEFTIVNW